VNCTVSSQNCHIQLWDRLCVRYRPIRDVTDWPEQPPRVKRATSPEISGEPNLTASATLPTFGNGGPGPINTTLPIPVLTSTSESRIHAATVVDVDCNVPGEPVEADLSDINEDADKPDIENITPPYREGTAPVNNTLPHLVSCVLVSSGDLHLCAETCGGGCTSAFFYNDLTSCVQHCLSCSVGFKSF